MKNFDLIKLYGITLDQFNQIKQEQGNRCKICNTDEPKGRHNCFHVDHCHSTGKVRGLLCNKCNVGLGSFKDDPEILKIAAEYLIKNK